MITKEPPYLCPECKSEHVTTQHHQTFMVTKELKYAAQECKDIRGLPPAWYDFDTLAITYGIGHTDAMFIAASSPDVVLTLVSELEELKLAYAEKSAAHGAAQREAELMVFDMEPVGYLAWRNDAPSWDEDCICNDAVYPSWYDDDRTSMPIYTATQLAAARLQGQRITEMEAALRQARDALDVATASLGSFTMDHGCSQDDFDNIDTALAALCKLNQILK